MKYLKLFEVNVKATDARFDPILRNFSEEILKLVTAVNNIDRANPIFAEISDKNIIKKYFTDNGINIMYNLFTGAKFRLLCINLKLINNNIKLTLLNIGLYNLNKQTGKKWTKNTTEFISFVESKLKKYKQPDDDVITYKGYQTIFVFPINNTNEVIEELKEYYAYSKAVNYNL